MSRQSRHLMRYLKLREKLDQVRDDSEMERTVREEMDAVWKELTIDEQAGVDTCPGMKIPFEDAT